MVLPNSSSLAAPNFSIRLLPANGTEQGMKLHGCTVNLVDGRLKDCQQESSIRVQCPGISSVFFKWLACLLSWEKFTLFQTDLYFQPCIANSARRQYLEAVNGLIAEPIFQVSVGDRDDRMTNGGMFQLGANQKSRIRCLESQKAAEHLAFAFQTIFWGYGMY